MPPLDFVFSPEFLNQEPRFLKSGITLTEPLSTREMNTCLSLLDNADLPANYRKALTEYYEPLKTKRVPLHYVNYIRRKNNIGRSFIGGKKLGSTNLPRRIRNTLYHETYYDFDMVNACPTILYEMIKNHEDFSTEFLGQYLGDRERILGETCEHYGTTRSKAKKLYSCLMNGGGVSKWKEENKIEGNQPNFPFAVKFKDELRRTGERLKQMNPDLWDKIKRMKLETAPEMKSIKNEIGSFMAFYTFHLEFLIVDRVMDFLNTRGFFDWNHNHKAYKVGIYELDGFKLRRDIVDSKLNVNELLQQINDFVLAEFEMDIQFAVKPMDEDLIEYTRVEPTPVISLEDPRYVEWRANFNAQGWCKIIEASMFVKRDEERGVLVIKTKTDIITAYEHETYMEGEKVVSCIRKWVEDPSMNVFETMDTYPRGMECPEKVYNLWTDSPFESQPITEEDPEFDREAVVVFLSHMRELLGEEAECNYVRCWISHAFQFPSVKPPKMITLIGDQGTGKSLLVNTIGQLFGEKRTFSSSSPERDIWGTFNGLVEGKDLIILNETGKQNSHQAEGQIKDLIDAGTITINAKQKCQYPTRSFHRFIQTTNSKDPVKTSQDDRRNVIIRCSDKLKGNFTYFENFVRTMARPNALRSIYWSFRVTPIDGWNGTQELKTAYHKLILSNSKEWIEEFMCHWVSKHYFTGTRLPPRKLKAKETAPHEECQYIHTNGKELLSDLARWRSELGYKCGEGINEGSLMLQIKTKIKGIPENPHILITSARSSKGYTQYIHIQALKDLLGVDIEEPDTDDSLDTNPNL